jgi:hypothetical protein
VAIVSAILLAASPAATLRADEAAAPMQLPDGPGRSALEKTCLGCHPADRIVAQRRTPAQWQEVMVKMSEQGAMATDEDFQSIYDYLVARYGAVADPAANPAAGTAAAPATAPGHPASTQ